MSAALDRAQTGSTQLRNVAWCLSNFMKGKVAPPLDLILPAVPALIRALQRTEQDVVILDVIWGLSFLTADSNPASLNTIINAGGIPILIRLLEHANLQISIPALRTIGNILASHDRDVSGVVINAGILELYSRMIDHNKQVMRKEVAWCLANVTAESSEMV